MNNLVRDADICVKCGLCLPHCPTYHKTGNENESPRGRIALIQAWASGQLRTSRKLLAHIDNCLLCRACERVCPAEVPYGRLVDGFRGRTKSNRTSLATILMKAIAHHKTVSLGGQYALRFYQAKGLQLLLRKLKLTNLPGLSSIDRLLPKPGGQLPVTQTFFPAIGKSKGSIGLFTGCIGSLLDLETVNAAIHCLTEAGFDLYLPAQQRCCGALAQHGGDAKTAVLLAEINCQAFAKSKLEAIVTIASGCGSQLKEYEDTEFAHKVIDISQFLMRSGLSFANKLRPLTESVCLHSPCSLKNAMNEATGAAQLLRRIPEMHLIELPEQTYCCGAAGTYMLEHPAMAKALAEDVLALALSTGARYLATSNIGCSLHLAAGLRDRNSNMEVIHPVALLARQLQL